MTSGRWRIYAVWLVVILLLVGSYKLTAYYSYSGRGLLLADYMTPYGGIGTGELAGFRQTGPETCGQAAAAFLLSAVGIPATEGSLIEGLGTAGRVSLGDLEQLFRDKGFKTQALSIDPRYFRQRPAAGILHLSEGHFVVFIQEAEGIPVLFDPGYGEVYVSWDILTKLFSGYMLYIYRA